MRVLKFGGSSLSNGRMFEKVSGIIAGKTMDGRTTTVLSAPSGVTNQLVALIDALAYGDSTEAAHAELLRRMNELTLEFESFLDAERVQQLRDEVEAIKNKINELCQGMSLLGHAPETSQAELMSMGEMFSVAAMRCFVEQKSIIVGLVDRKNIVAEGEILSGTACLKLTRERLRQWMERHDQVEAFILPGFVAESEEGQVMVLGRNGSDYTAAITAAALEANLCEIWTDVDGVYSADPRFVDQAKLVKYLTYDEAMELSYFGAKVLHPKTIAPLARYQIPCQIKNTLNPDAEGTLISSKTSQKGEIKAISSLPSLALISVTGPGMKGMVGMAARVFDVMASQKISVVLITQSSSEYSISFCIHQEQLEKAMVALHENFSLELKAGHLKPFETKKNVGIVSLIGDGMRSTKGLAAKFFASLAQARINISAIAQGSSERSISTVIEGSQCMDAVRVCHENFFTHKPSIDVFLIGCGGVGSELVEQIAQQKSMLSNRGINLRLFGISNSKRMLMSAGGVDLNNWQNALNDSDQSFSLVNVSRFVEEQHLVNPVLVDCTSSEHIAAQYAEFMAAGFHVVTANKKANTGSMGYYHELRNTALKHHRRFLYETNVGAGLPVIDTLQGLINAGDKMSKFEGILSGSLSYIFGKMEEGMSFSEATRVAKEKGFTEPDPRDDLSGMDVARKLLIMARESGLEQELHDIQIESVLPKDADCGGDVDTFMQKLPEIDAHFDQLIEQAKREDKVLRYVGKIENGRCVVCIQAVGPQHPLYAIKDGENALSITSEYYQPIPMVLRGYGAGSAVTAAGVFGDLLRTLSWQQGV
ncbi:bifunctional aspartate kinase/homoserine dehydrogenase I [Algicola sagamiensis]|uniref:bifunctional aspartate kinase/homoserine dehydrogenase I n=1 Tax=Algicola sagamiensis TaxID=163869 RepID=UPI000362F1A5|nr:bifunctional aspartate kinase/homoserine dehydrogenase I [Algicola sagamiensis]